MEMLSDLDNKTVEEAIADFLRDRDVYYKNAEKLIAQGKLRKASEMLWGAVTQSVKALAAARNIKISKHKDFFHFLREVSRELGDDYYYSSFVELNDLHRNFYDEFIPEDAFYLLHKKAFDFIKKTEELLHKIVQERVR